MTGHKIESGTERNFRFKSLCLEIEFKQEGRLNLRKTSNMAFVYEGLMEKIFEYAADNWGNNPGNPRSHICIQTRRIRNNLKI